MILSTHVFVIRVAVDLLTRVTQVDICNAVMLSSSPKVCTYTNIANVAKARGFSNYPKLREFVQSELAKRNVREIAIIDA